MAVKLNSFRAKSHMQNEDGLPPQPQKGARIPLAITPMAKQRLLCGLRWNPKREGEASGLDTLKDALTGSNRQTCDLDLMCVMYDEAGEFVDGVSGMPDELMDASGKVYHSGDDTAGISSHDDEQIFVETLDLPGYIHHIVFIVEIQSVHTFDRVDEPTIRLADSYNDKPFLQASLGGPEGKDRTAFVFARVARDGQGWAARYIGDFHDGRKIADWTETCKAYLK